MGARRHSKFAEPAPVLTEEEWGILGLMVERNQIAYGGYPGRTKMKKLGYVKFTGQFVLGRLPTYRPTVAGALAWAEYRVKKDGKPAVALIQG